MAKVDGGELFVRTLEAAGIDTLFTLHGGHLDAIFQATRERPIRLVDMRHEQAAGHAADGYARTTGKTGVAIVTAGPGFTDCVTAIANAYLDCVPTLFVAGAAPLRDAETLPLQGGIDQLAMVAPITKWAHRVTHTERIADLTAQALRVARSGRPGPVYLELPIDVLFARVDEERATRPGRFAPDAVAAPTPEAVERAIALLHAAERPAILAGGGAFFAGAGPRAASRSPSAPRHPCSRTRRRTASCRAITRSAVAASGRSAPRPPRGSARRTWCSCSARGSGSSPAGAALA